MSLDRCRIVLVGTRFPGNLGATARVMRNHGLCDLVLVSPEADPLSHPARQMATHGEDVLTAARVVNDLGEAVGDCLLVLGTSARTGGLFRKQTVGTPEELLPRLVETLPTGRAALVFGPEPTGLTNEEVARCHHLITIPTDPTCPALNLAQAVAICLYELRRTWLRATAPLPAREAEASYAEQEQMFAHLRKALEEIHFLYGDKADSLMHAVRHLIARAHPTPTEVGILHGLARQLEWNAGRIADCRLQIAD